MRTPCPNPAVLGSLLLLGALPASAQGLGAGAEPVATASASDPYAEAMARARAAATPAELDAAAGELSVLLPRYPQDVDLPLQLGWLLFRAGRFSPAADAYRQAVTRGTGGGDAELGLAWSLLKLERCTEARPHFLAVQAAQGAGSNAAEGLRLCSAPDPSSPSHGSAQAPSQPAATSALAKRWWLQPQLAQSLYVFQNQPVLTRALATTARLEAMLHDRWYGALVYRYSYFGTQDGQTAAFGQHDLYAAAGVTSKPAGLTLQYAVIADRSASAQTSHHVGLAARYSFVGDVLFNGSASIYPDAPVLRGELAFRMPLPLGLSVRPSGALQWIPGESFRTAGLTLAYDHPRLSLWVGGKYGDEKRPAYLGVFFIYNSPARIPYGAWAGASVRPGSGFLLSASYSYDRLIRTDVMPRQDSLFHTITLSLSKAL